jgi:hypothetical protein
LGCLGGCARWFPQVVPGPPSIGARRARPRMSVTAAAGMTVLLLGAVITRQSAAEAGKEMAPALLTLAITIAYLAVALTS